MIEAPHSSSEAEESEAASSPASSLENERTKGLRDKPWKAERAVLPRSWKAAAGARRALMTPEQSRQYWIWWLVRGAFYGLVSMVGFTFMILPIAIKALIYSKGSGVYSGHNPTEFWYILGFVVIGTLLSFQLYKLQDRLKEELDQRS